MQTVLINQLLGINNMSGLRCCRHSLDVSNPHSMAGREYFKGIVHSTS